MRLFNSKTKTATLDQKGFTLVEMLVSVGLFAVVMVIATGVIFSIFDGNRKQQAISSVADNLNFSIDSMVRDIKTGYEYRCVPQSATEAPLPVVIGGISACTNPGNRSSISLISTITGVERSVKYQLQAPTNGEPGYIQKTVCDPSCEDERLTSPQIDITKLEFYVTTPTPGQGQPGVTVLVSGKAVGTNLDAAVSDFSIQTYISQRVLNI